MAEEAAKVTSANLKAVEESVEIIKKSDFLALPQDEASKLLSRLASGEVKIEE